MRIHPIVHSDLQASKISFHARSTDSKFDIQIDGERLKYDSEKGTLRKEDKPLFIKKYLLPFILGTGIVLAPSPNSDALKYENKFAPELNEIGKNGADIFKQRQDDKKFEQEMDKYFERHFIVPKKSELQAHPLYSKYAKFDSQAAIKEIEKLHKTGVMYSDELDYLYKFVMADVGRMIKTLSRKMNKNAYRFVSEYIKEKKYDIDPMRIFFVMYREHRFEVFNGNDPNVMQVMGEDTINAINKRHHSKKPIIPDTYENSIMMGIDLLDMYSKNAYEKFSTRHESYGIGNPDELMLVYYNQGPGRTEGKIKRNKSSEFSKTYARFVEGLTYAYSILKTEFSDKEKIKQSV